MKKRFNDYMVTLSQAGQRSERRVIVKHCVSEYAAGALAQLTKCNRGETAIVSNQISR